MSSKTCQKCKYWQGNDSSFIAECGLANAVRSRTQFDDTCSGFENKPGVYSFETFTATVGADTLKRLANGLQQRGMTPVPQHGYTNAPQRHYPVGLDSSGHVVAQDDDGKLFRIDSQGQRIACEVRYDVVRDDDEMLAWDEYVPFKGYEVKKGLGWVLKNPNKNRGVVDD